MVHRGAQWAVDQETFRALPPERYSIPTRWIGNIDDWGNGPVYEFPVHMAEKSWVDIDDLISVFRAAWYVYGALQPAQLDDAIMERTVQQARKVSGRGY